MIKIFLLLNPPTVTVQMNKVTCVNGKPIFYKKDKLKQARKILLKYLKPFKPLRPLEGTIELKVIWKFPKGKTYKHNEWRVTRPDIDNLQKMLKDCMTEVGYWKDDAQVVVEHVEKLWSDEPTGIAIEIEVLDNLL